jgi:hypothetical protein
MNDSEQVTPEQLREWADDVESNTDALARGAAFFSPEVNIEPITKSRRELVAYLRRMADERGKMYPLSEITVRKCTPPGWMQQGGVHDAR